MNKVLYDKDCGVCENFASFVLKKCTKFKFVPLTSSSGKKTLKELNLPADYSKKIILIEGDLVFFGSCCVLKMFKSFPYPYKIFYALFFIPRFIREPFYVLFAKFRNKFSKKTSCSV